MATAPISASSMPESAVWHLTLRIHKRWLPRALAAQADVLIENFRPGVMNRLGLGQEALRAINPRLVYCSISGYGQTGPAAQQAAYAMILQAASGYERTLMRYAGDRDRPAATATFVADVLGAIFAFGSIQAALVQRARTGEGQCIDVALMDCMLNLLVYELQEAQFPVTTPRPTYGPIRASDGDLLVVPITPRNFTTLCEVTGLTELRDDPRFATLPARNANWDVMMAVTEQWTRRRTVAQCLQTLQTAGVPCSEYAEPADALYDAQVQSRGLFQQVRDAAGQFRAVNAPWLMSGTASRMRSDVPSIGQHATAVLKDWLGLDNTQAQALRQSGALGDLQS